MTTLKPLLAKNRSWALEQCERNPDYFTQNASGQKPHSLWIGCSDSRVPAEVLTGCHPGELFVHRNIANMVALDDDNAMSVLQYAVDYLGVWRIVICGHYGCGGVQAALSLPQLALAQEKSPLARRITRLRAGLGDTLAQITALADEQSALNALVEANVLAQFSQLVQAEPVVRAWQEGRELNLYGCVYDLHSGHLKPLIEQSGREEQPDA